MRAPPRICEWNVQVESFTGGQAPRVGILALHLASSVGLNKFLNRSVPQCLHLYIGVIIGPLGGLFAWQSAQFCHYLYLGSAPQKLGYVKLSIPRFVICKMDYLLGLLLILNELV